MATKIKYLGTDSRFAYPAREGAAPSVVAPGGVTLMADDSAAARYVDAGTHEVTTDAVSDPLDDAPDYEGDPVAALLARVEELETASADYATRIAALETP